MTVGERIKTIREHLKQNQRDFAKSIDISQPALAMLEKGQREINNRHISLICMKHGISEEWLRTGKGEMYNIQTDDYTNISVDIDKNDPKARQAIIDYWNLSDEDKILFWNFIERFVKNK